MNPDQIWLDTLNVLRSQTTKATFDGVFQSTTLVDVNGCFTIQAPHKLSVEWMDKRLRNTIANALSQVTQQTIVPAQLQFIPAPEKCVPVQPADEATGQDVPIHVRDGRKERRYWIDNEFIYDGYAAYVRPAGVAVYNLLCCRANKNQQAWPGQGGMAADLGLTRPTIGSAVARLESCNVILIEPRFNEQSCEWESNLYTLTDLSEWVKVWEGQ